MKATINITTPAGKSLEGFPVTENPQFVSFDLSVNDLWAMTGLGMEDSYTQLHKGDTITIKIEE